MNLSGMTLEEQVEHLKWRIEEITEPPEEYADMLESLTSNQRAMVGLMLKREGRTVSRAALYAAADTRLTAEPENSLKAQICYIRKRLREAGVPIEIQTSWGIGYRAVWK